MRALELKPTHKPVQTYYAASTGDLRRLGSDERNSPDVKAPCGPSERARASHWVGVRCRRNSLAHRSINPNLADDAVEEMQALLTERLFRTVFNNAGFSRRNIIAAEIKKVIDALARQMQGTSWRGEQLGLAKDEVAVHDARTVNGSAAKAPGDEKLGFAAWELLKTIRENAMIDWTARDHFDGVDLFALRESHG